MGDPVEVAHDPGSFTIAGLVGNLAVSVEDDVGPLVLTAGVDELHARQMHLRDHRHAHGHSALVGQRHAGLGKFDLRGTGQQVEYIEREL